MKTINNGIKQIEAGKIYLPDSMLQQLKGQIEKNGEKTHPIAKQFLKDRNLGYKWIYDPKHQYLSIYVGETENDLNFICEIKCDITKIKIPDKGVLESQAKALKILLDAIVEKQKALQMTDRAIKIYNEVKAAETEYEQKIRPAMSIFRDIGRHLCCFAGCTDREHYDMLAGTLYNRRGDIEYCFNRKYKIGDTVESCEYYELPGTDTGEYIQDQEMSSLFDALDSIFCDLTKNEMTDARGKLMSFWENVKKSPFFEYFECSFEKTKKCPLAEKIEKDTKRVKEKTEDAQAKADNIISDIKRKYAYIQDRRIQWDYIRFLNGVLPLIREIVAVLPDELTTEWCIDMTERLHTRTEELNDHMKFIRLKWIFPDDDLCMTTKIRYDFEPAGASWPGLYFTWKDTPNAVPSCVLNGGIFTN